MITVHMTTYRRFGTQLLKRAVDSVLSQDFEDFEFIICDDGSTDGTAEYLTGVAAGDSRIKVFRNPRNVNSVAISLGRCMSQSNPARPWVSWMFDDCVLRPGALSLLVEAAGEEKVDMLYGVTDVVLPNGGVLRVGDKSPELVREEISRSSVLVPNGGILIHREVFNRIGWYDPSIILRRSCDWDLFRRIIIAGVSFATIPDTLMEEHGALQSDSLRNAFTTTFELMAKFVRARDQAGVPLDLRSALAMPVDWIPPANWSEDELALMRFMFIEYFLSIGDLPRAFRWARLLEPSLPGDSLTLQNLLRAASGPGGDSRAMAAGAYTGVVMSSYRDHARAQREMAA